MRFRVRPSIRWSIGLRLNRKGDRTGLELNTVPSVGPALLHFEIEEQGSDIVHSCVALFPLLIDGTAKMDRLDEILLIHWVSRNTAWEKGAVQIVDTVHPAGIHLNVPIHLFPVLHSTSAVPDPITRDQHSNWAHELWGWHAADRVSCPQFPIRPLIPAPVSASFVEWDMHSVVEGERCHFASKSPLGLQMLSSVAIPALPVKWFSADGRVDDRFGPTTGLSCRFLSPVYQPSVLDEVRLHFDVFVSLGKKHSGIPNLR